MYYIYFILAKLYFYINFISQPHLHDLSIYFKYTKPSFVLVGKDVIDI
jgi:hypothetical protein